MKLLLVRHARAEKVKEFARTGADDSMRPLTDDGRDRMRRIARGLHRLVDDIDVLATSPFARTRQSADIIAAEYGLSQVIELDELRPGSPPDALAHWLRDAGARETIAIVGHNMQLSELVGWLVAGRAKPVVEIRKGGAVMLQLRVRGKQHKRHGLRRARVLWSLTPRQLRMLAAPAQPVPEPRGPGEPGGRGSYGG